MTTGAAFWLCIAVFIICEYKLYDKGHDTLLWKHKTPAELDIQRTNIEKGKT